MPNLFEHCQGAVGVAFTPPVATPAILAEPRSANAAAGSPANTTPQS